MQADALSHQLAMARMNEEALREMLLTRDLTAQHSHLLQQMEQLRKEGQVMQMESKALNAKNAEMKQAFALLLDRFQDYVNTGEGSMEGMRATIKRLSIENQRLKVNYHLEAKDIKDRDIRLNQKEQDDALR